MPKIPILGTKTLKISRLPVDGGPGPVMIGPEVAPPLARFECIQSRDLCSESFEVQIAVEAEHSMMPVLDPGRLGDGRQPRADHVGHI